MLSLIAASTLSPPAFSADFDRQHKLFTQDLGRFVEKNRVHYRRWKKDSARLEKYLDSLAHIDKKTYEKLSDAEKTALWINAYNAATIKMVLEHYPIQGKDEHYPPHSIRQIPDVWENTHLIVAGRKVSLYELEHDILRREIHDPRAHFAVVPAAIGCPPLRAKAFTSDTLERDLDEAAKSYLSKNVEFNFKEKTVRVPAIFSWFPLDFAPAVGLAKVKFPPPKDDDIVLRYVVRQSPPRIQKYFQEDAAYKQFKVIYRPSNWTLNDADLK